MHTQRSTSVLKTRADLLFFTLLQCLDKPSGSKIYLDIECKVFRGEKLKNCCQYSNFGNIMELSCTLEGVEIHGFPG